MAHLLIAFMRLIAPWPLPVVRALGAGLGGLLWLLARRRRHIALVNLRLCFPDLDEAARVRLARRHFVAFGQSVLDRAWLWHASEAVLRERLQWAGAWHEITDELGQRFEISFNTYKPFACGIVIHPSIDACTQLRAQGVTAEQVERIELRVHSLVLELTGKKEPADGLQGKFSVYHGCACGLIFGKAGEDQYADEIVNRPDMVALRRKVVAVVDDRIDEASADVTAILKDGRKVHVFVEHAIGSLQNPMTDAKLESKFHDLSDPVLGAARTHQVIEACWKLGSMADVRSLTTLSQG